MIKHTEVDGVPTVIAPTSGQLHAGLYFRVGRVDESLARSGISHLLEHLVLFPLGVADYHFNGSTGDTLTHFHMQGSERDVAQFLTRVCSSLAELPMHRLETEKEILRTEASGRSSHITDPLAMWRHGARGRGLQGYPEWGLSMIGPDELRRWAATYFTRDNAVLWIAGDGVPEGLSLDLPAGQRRPIPAATSALPTTPAWFAGPARSTTAWDTMIPRSTTARIFSDVLEREMYRALRQESGLSYTAGTGYEVHGDGTATIVAVADALPEKADAVLGGFADVLAKLRVGRIEPADVESAVGKAVDGLGNAEADAVRLPGYAVNMLVGQPNSSIEELVAELRAVTPAGVAAVATEALGNGLLMVPSGRRGDWAGFTAAPVSSTTAVDGTAYPMAGKSGSRLVAGPAGVSEIHADDIVTVEYGDCAAMLAFPDGGRLLIGADAITVRVEPTLFPGVHLALPAIDAAVGADRRVDMPAREPDEIPQPGDRTPAKPGAAPAGSGRGGTIALLILLWLVFVPMVVFSLLLTIGAALETEDRALTVTVVLFGYAVSAALLYGIVRTTRRLSRR